MLAGILSYCQTLLSRLTATRAGYLDKLNITGNVCDGASYTSTRATKLDNLDTTITSRAPSSTALSNTIWTNTRAGYLDDIRKIPQIKKYTNCLLSQTVALGDIISKSFVTGHGGISFQNKLFGIRKVIFLDGTDTLVDALNISSTGWILGIAQFNMGSASRNSQLVIIVDGITLQTSTYGALSAGYALLGHGNIGGLYGFSSGTSGPINEVQKKFICPALLPIRFDSTLIVRHRANATDVATEILYIED
jgi:hypothetical protein